MHEGKFHATKAVGLSTCKTLKKSPAKLRVWKIYLGQREDIEEQVEAVPDESVFLRTFDAAGRTEDGSPA